MRLLAGKKIAAIGPATAGAIERMGLKVDLVPNEYKAEGLADALGEAGVKGKKFLLARARAARNALPEALKEMGGKVFIAPIYDTRVPEGNAERLRELLEKKTVDIAVFTSSSTVDFSMRALGAAGRGSFRDGRVAALSIGPVTSASLRKWGIRPAAEARPHTLEGLAAAAVSYYMKSRT